MEKQQLLYSGKAKSLFATSDSEQLIMQYRDDASAFDGVKKASLARKGLVNNHFNAFIMRYLQVQGINTHFVKLLNDNESVVRNLTMIPVECVVRNIAAGSLCKRLGVEQGRELLPPLFEFFLKDDHLHDPMLNESHIITFDLASKEEIAEMKAMTLQVNQLLLPLFEKAGIRLVDFKLEFGRIDETLCLGDEFSPDGCRLWDIKSGERLDKDRFRQDLGNVIESYEEVANRLGIELP